MTSTIGPKEERLAINYLSLLSAHAAERSTKFTARKTCFRTSVTQTLGVKARNIRSSACADHAGSVLVSSHARSCSSSVHQRITRAHRDGSELDPSLCECPLIVMQVVSRHVVLGSTRASHSPHCFPHWRSPDLELSSVNLLSSGFEPSYLRLPTLVLPSESFPAHQLAHFPSRDAQEPATFQVRRQLPPV
jgi:hypothetical protein